MSLVKITQEITYWDGYKEVTKELVKYLESEKYSINHALHHESIHGTNKNVTHDADEVSIISDVTFSPQNNTDITTQDFYSIPKDRYTSYTDANILDDTETFTFSNNFFNNTVLFNIRKDGNYILSNTIDFYNGFWNEQSTITHDITASVLVPNLSYEYTARNGLNASIVGRDDEVQFLDTSVLNDFYDALISDGSRYLSTDWIISNPYNDYNFDSISQIGGSTFPITDLSNESIGNSLYNSTFNVNFLSEGNKNVDYTFNYNDGYFNRSSTSNINSILVNPYDDITIDATYPSTVLDRHTNVFIEDNSSIQDRIIDIDWSLTDRYEANSLSGTQNQDNLQLFSNLLYTDSINTNIHSNELHTLSQLVRWDNGFELIEFERSYIINTLEDDVIISMNYSHKYNTGPEIDLTNTSSTIGINPIIDHIFTINDTDNDLNDTSIVYPKTSTLTQHHVFQSVGTKSIGLEQFYDDGWNYVSKIGSFNINVLPNTITIDFTHLPNRHVADTGIIDSTIIGNNSFTLSDNSTSSRVNDLGQDDLTSIVRSTKFEAPDCP